MRIIRNRSRGVALGLAVLGAACSFPLVASAQTSSHQRYRAHTLAASNSRIAFPRKDMAATQVSVLEPAPARTASSGTTAHLPKPTRVAFFSDSIGFESKDYLREALAEQGDRLATYEGYPGTALCTYLPAIAEQATNRAVDIVLIEFAGNIWGPCIEPRIGPSDEREQALAAYEHDIRAAIDFFDRSSVRIGIVLAPEPVGLTTSLHDLNSLYRRVAHERGVLTIDAGKYFVDSTGTPRGELACLPDEPCDDTGRAVVRSPDRTHLCPVSHPGGLTCPTYSSGGRRFAKAVAESIALP